MLSTNLSNEEYRALKAWSKSDLDLLHKSPALVEWNRNIQADPSQSVDLGTHLHCLLLEPERFNDEYAYMPQLDANNKAAYLEVIKGRIILDGATHETLQAMKASALAHPVLRSLLTDPSGISEASIVSKLNGVKVKCRPDRIIRDRHIILDLKKTADINKFKYSVIDFRYHVQAAFYSDIYKEETGIEPRFVFGVIGEKKELGRYPVRVFELDAATMQKARIEYYEDLEAASDFDNFGCSLNEFETLRVFR